MGINRWELNAHLQTLISGWDPDSANVVVTAFHCLQHPKSKETHIKTTKRKGGIIEGCTNETGNISIADDENIKTSVKGERESEYERIGKFKVVRWENLKKNCAIIRFWEFWASDVCTMGEEDPIKMYGLEYDLETKEAYAFIIFDWIEKNPPIIDAIESYLYDFISWFTLRMIDFSSRTRAWTTAPWVIYGQSRVFKS